MHGLVYDDGITGAALRLAFVGPQRIETETEADGTFAVELTKGKWTIYPVGPGLEEKGLAVRWVGHGEPSPAVAWGHAEVSVWVEPPPALLEGMTRTWLVEARPTGNLRLDLLSPRQVTGDVVDFETGRALPGVTVTVSDMALPGRPHEFVRSTTTDAVGRFHMRVPRRHAFAAGALRVEAGGYGAMATGLPDASDPPVHFALRRAFALEGRVEDLEGRPIAAASVQVKVSLPDPGSSVGVLPHTWTVTSDGQGRFRCDVPLGAGQVGPHAAHVGLEVTHHDHAPGLGDVVVPRAEPLVLRLARAVALSGRVLRPDGAPVPSARLWSLGAADDESLAAAAGERVTTDGDGRFEFTAVPERGFLEVEAEGFPKALFETWLPVREVELRLEPPARMRGRLVHHDGRPARNVHVRARGHGAPEAQALRLALDGRGVRRVDLASAGGDVGWARAAADGTFELLHLPPESRYDLYVFDSAAATDAPQLRGLHPDTDGHVIVVDRPSARVHYTVETEQPTDEEVTLRVLAADERVVDRRPGLGRSSMRLPEGRFVFDLRVPGFRPVARTCDVRPGEELTLAPLRLVPGGGTIALQVQWPAVASPALRIRYKDPLTGLHQTEWLRAPSRLDASCEIEAVGAGEVTLDLTLVVCGHGLALPPMTVTVRDGETTRVELSAIPR